MQSTPQSIGRGRQGASARLAVGLALATQNDTSVPAEACPAVAISVVDQESGETAYP